MVKTSFPCASWMGYWQDKTDSLSTSTVQAPQNPSPQLYFYQCAQDQNAEPREAYGQAMWSNEHLFRPILFDDPFPLSDCAFRRFRIAKARQIDEKVRTVNPIKIYTLSFARGRTGPGQLPVTCEPINQAGLAHIGSARKHYFRNPFLREIAFRDGANYKFGLDHGDRGELCPESAPEFRARI